MIVCRSNFSEILTGLMRAPKLALDTEAFGLRMYHGDRLFSVIIATSEKAYYFNFLPYAGMSEDWILGPEHLQKLRPLLEREDIELWFLQNAKFDMRILAQENLYIKGPIHCTKAIGRVEYNAHLSYSLDAQLTRIGLKKDDKVKAYIMAHKLFDWETIPGKARKNKRLHFDKVPFEIIHPYGEADGTGTFALGISQIVSINKQDKDDAPKAVVVSGTEKRSLSNVLWNERRLTHTVFRMEHAGCLVDVDFCKRAAEYELARIRSFENYFKQSCGSEYSASNPLLQKVFESERSKWEFTKKGNPSFESASLQKFTNPLAKTVLDIRDAKSKMDFYSGFLYHADRDGRIHTSFNPDGAAHGRFSSSDPNLQNLTDEEDRTADEFIVRRAIIPTPGFSLLSIDYKSMEYVFMLEMACRLTGGLSELASLVNGGLDVHEATAQLATRAGVPILRRAAKTSNFLTLYGGGNQKLADGLLCSLEQARAIRSAIFRAAPEIKRYISWLQAKAESDGYIVNWLGRKSHFPNRAFAYKAPNYHCSGGCADIVKVAMNRIDDLLLPHESRMIMQIHDEFVFEIKEGEEWLEGPIKTLMRNAFQSKYLPLDVSSSWSKRSLGDLNDVA